jgi:hypothetical protein
VAGLTAQRIAWPILLTATVANSQALRQARPSTPQLSRISLHLVAVLKHRLEQRAPAALSVMAKIHAHILKVEVVPFGMGIVQRVEEARKARQSADAHAADHLGQHREPTKQTELRRAWWVPHRLDLHGDSPPLATASGYSPAGLFSTFTFLSRSAQKKHDEE